MLVVPLSLTFHGGFSNNSCKTYVQTQLIPTGSKRFRPEFVTNVVSPNEGKVLFNALCRDFRALDSALMVLSPGQKLAVEQFAVDMHDPFILAIKKNCPNAKVVIDRFHLAQKINEAFDKLRKSEFKKARETNDRVSRDMLEPHRRFILVARDKHLSKAEERLIDKLRYANQNIHAGMTNPTSFLRKILQRCGYLNHRSINTDDFFFRVPHPA